MKYKYSFNYSKSRDNAIIEICRGKKVLHIGACDAPYTEDKYNNNLLLHSKIKCVASELVGIDIDEYGIEKMHQYGYKEVLYFDMNKLIDLKFSPEVIIFGETIEHLLNFPSVFRNIKASMSEDTHLCISTPNAYHYKNFTNAISGFERNHEDHTVAFTPRTIERMLDSNGLTITSRTMTFLDRKKVRFLKRLERSTLALFPMLAETMLIECTIHKS